MEVTRLTHANLYLKKRVACHLRRCHWKACLPQAVGPQSPLSAVHTILSEAWSKDKMGFLLLGCAPPHPRIRTAERTTTTYLPLGRTLRAQRNKEGQVLSLPSNQSCAFLINHTPHSPGPSHFKKHKRL